MTSSAENPRDWSLGRRIGFRFLFSYLVFYNIPQKGSASIFDILPWGNGPLNEWLAKPMQPVAIWLGAHLFHLTGVANTFHDTGSGDTALNYVLVFMCLCLAAIATVVWSILDRKRTQYRVLEAWLRLFVSFVVGESLVEYGFAKIFPNQFGPIALSRLNETYGDSSPMALLWTFMSGSHWYTVFGGFAEVVPGLMLFFRRTRTIGALMGGAVMMNVFMLNMCYDVPVKLYSFHLLAMCIFLAWPDLHGLARLFFFREQAQLRTDHIPAVERRWLRRTGYVLLGLVVVCTLLSVGVGAYRPYPKADTSAPLYGVWRVDHASATKATIPWKEIVISDAQNMSVRCVDGTRFCLSAKKDSTDHSIKVKSPKFGDSVLHYATDPEDPRHVTIDGPFNHGSLHLDLVRRSPDSYTLLTRGFHWVNEDPPNY
jgi:hypothetical protein